MIVNKYFIIIFCFIMIAIFASLYSVVPTMDPIIKDEDEINIIYQDYEYNKKQMMNLFGYDVLIMNKWLTNHDHHFLKYHEIKRLNPTNIEQIDIFTIKKPRGLSEIRNKIEAEKIFEDYIEKIINNLVDFLYKSKIYETKHLTKKLCKGYARKIRQYFGSYSPVLYTNFNLDNGKWHLLTLDGYNKNGDKNFIKIYFKDFDNEIFMVLYEYPGDRIYIQQEYMEIKPILESIKKIYTISDLRTGF